MSNRTVCIYLGLMRRIYMVRPIYFLCMAIAMILLSGISFADDYEDCRLSCAGERDTRNMDCPSPYDASDEERRQCLNESQAAYENCISDCPAPPPVSSPSSEQNSPPRLGPKSRKDSRPMKSVNRQ